MVLPRPSICLAGTVRVYALPLQTAEDWAALLTPEERARAARFRFAADRDRNVLGRAAARVIIGQTLGIAPSAVTFGAGPQGKPSSSVKFNVSHSGDWVLLAVGDPDREVGVDVELMRGELALPSNAAAAGAATPPASTLDLMDVARTVFTDRELDALHAAPHEARARFFRIWARKEAVLKAWGTGFSLEARLVHAGLNSEVRAPDERYPPATVEELPIDALHAGAVAVAPAL